MSVIQNDLEPHMTFFKRHVAEVALGVGISVGMCVFVCFRQIFRIQDQIAQDNMNRAGRFSFFTGAVVATAVMDVVVIVMLWLFVCIDMLF